MLKEKLMDLIDLKIEEVDFYNDYEDDNNRPTEVAAINATLFDDMAEKVRQYSHETDWDEGRTIVIYTYNGKFTMWYINDRIDCVYAEDLSLSWYFDNKCANLISREELIELFIG